MRTNTTGCLAAVGNRRAGCHPAPQSRELLAVGIFGGTSLGDRIEMLLKRGREFSPRVSALRVGTTAAVLLMLMVAGSLAPHWIAFAQQPDKLAFEVASVKANRSTGRSGRGMQVLPSGRLVMTNVPLFIIVATAYDVPFQSNRLSGGPDWIRSEGFDIEATPAAGAIPQVASSTVRQNMIREMLRTLLAERFKMTVRRETKEQPVYAAVVGKNGPKLEKSKLEEKDCTAGAAEFGNGSTCHSFTGGQGRGLHGQAASIADIAVFVSNWTDRPVVDKTGLQGLFNIQTDGWLPMQTGPPPAADAKGEDGKLLADQPTIFEIFERLGLKLEPQRAPVEMFVIEHAERLTEN